MNRTLAEAPPLTPSTIRGTRQVGLAVSDQPSLGHQWIIHRLDRIRHEFAQGCFVWAGTSNPAPPPADLPGCPVKHHGRGSERPASRGSPGDEESVRGVRPVRRWADSRTRSGRFGRCAAASPAAHRAARPLQLDRVSFQRSYVGNPGGAEGDIGAIHFAVFDGDGRVAATAAAAESAAAFHGAGDGVSILPEGEDLGGSAAETATASARYGSYRYGSPQARDPRPRWDLALPDRHLRPKLHSFRGDRYAGGRQPRRTCLHRDRKSTRLNSS